MLTTAKESEFVKFTIVLIELLEMTLMFPPASSILVFFKPISTTVPRKSSTTTISPTSKALSATKKIPATTSLIRLWQPRPTIRAMIPIEARILLVSTPHLVKIKKMATIIIAHLINDLIKDKNVAAFLFLSLNLFAPKFNKAMISKEMAITTTV